MIFAFRNMQIRDYRRIEGSKKASMVIVFRQNPYSQSGDCLTTSAPPSYSPRVFGLPQASCPPPLLFVCSLPTFRTRSKLCKSQMDSSARASKKHVENIKHRNTIHKMTFGKYKSWGITRNEKYHHISKYNILSNRYISSPSPPPTS